jgi:hypothetical protein
LNNSHKTISMALAANKAIQNDQDLDILKKEYMIDQTSAYAMY